MRQSSSVQPATGLPPIPKTRGQFDTPVHHRNKRRKRSAPPTPTFTPNLTLRVPIAETEVEESIREEEALENYQTVPIAYKYVEPKPAKTKLPPILRLIDRTRTTSIDSESPLVTPCPRRDSIYSPTRCSVSPGFKGNHRLSTISTLASQTLKKPFEANATICDDAEMQGSERPLADTMAASTKAREILLGENSATVLEALAKDVPLKYPLLDLSSRNLTDSDLYHIVHLLDIYPFATHLDLYGNRLKFTDCGDISFGNPHKSIRKLTLSGNPLGGLPTTTVLGRFLSLFSSLELLELSNCSLNDDDFFRIYSNLLSLPRLQSISLTGNFLTPKSALLISQICTLNASVRLIDLRNNPFQRRKLRGFQGKVVTDGGKKCCCHVQ